jgi:hypothetical protein
VTIETASGDPLLLQKELSEDGKEVLLYCQSEGREAKERAMASRFEAAFEAGLKKIAAVFAIHVAKPLTREP